MNSKIPAKIEKVSNEVRIGKILNFGRIEENSKVGIFLVRVVLIAVVAIVDEFDFFDVFDFGLIKVCIG